MKKILALLLVFVMTVPMIACGKSNNDSFTSSCFPRLSGRRCRITFVVHMRKEKLC